MSPTVETVSHRRGEAVVPGPMKSMAKDRWLKVGGFAKKVAAMSKMLQASGVLGTPGQPSDPAEKGHNDYMAKLRMGVKKETKKESVLRSLGLANKATALTDEATNIMQSGSVVTTVSTEEELENLELWQQGDASLATKEKMMERQKLRHDKRVLEALQAFWEAALRSVQSEGDEVADFLHREGHAIMLRRIYRVMIRKYDPEEAEKAIAEDWKNDAKGADVLRRKQFCDAFFELAVCHHIADRAIHEPAFIRSAER